MHMNDTALEYFQSANVGGKSADQMIREFRAIQRFKEEELVAQQLNQGSNNEYD